MSAASDSRKRAFPLEPDDDRKGSPSSKKAKTSSAVPSYVPPKDSLKPVMTLATPLPAIRGAAAGGGGGSDLVAAQIAAKRAEIAAKFAKFAAAPAAASSSTSSSSSASAAKARAAAAIKKEEEPAVPKPDVSEIAKRVAEAKRKVEEMNAKKLNLNPYLVCVALTQYSARS